MMQDSIDFGTMNIPKLFRMMFIPTLLGMVLSATINIADGIFVGRGVGSDMCESSLFHGFFSSCFKNLHTR